MMSMDVFLSLYNIGKSEGVVKNSENQPKGAETADITY